MKETSMMSIVFVQTLAQLPSVEEMTIVDMHERAEILQAAGFTRVTKRELRIATVSEFYTIIAEEDKPVYGNHFSAVVSLNDYTGLTPPNDAAIAIRNALNSGLFDDISLGVASSGETIAVGRVIEEGFENALFSVAQWGYELSSLESLRARLASPGSKKRWFQKK